MPLAPLPVRVIESARRKKTVSARIVDDTIEVRVPAHMRTAERERHVADLVRRLEKKRAKGTVDLAARARELARRHDLPEPTTIVWSDRQNRRWGSCTPATGAVRISHRLAEVPTWVLDHVIVHELAHLVVPDHSPAFHELVARYPKAERAEGFLIAMALGHAGSAGPMDAGCFGDQPSQ